MTSASQVLFADAAFWIAISSRRDEHHNCAVAWGRHIRAARTKLVTTEAVLWEWLNALAHPDTRHLAHSGYEKCAADPEIEIVGFSDDRVIRALELYRDRPDKAWGATDCLSFVVMQDRRIEAALTSDHHFEQAGFRTLLGENPPSGSTA